MADLTPEAEALLNKGLIGAPWNEDDLIAIEAAAAKRERDRLRAGFRAADEATRWGGPWTLGDIEAVLDAVENDR